MGDESLKRLVGRLVRYLANAILLLAILSFLTRIISGILVGDTFSLFSDAVFWTQLNCLFLVVIMLILVENFYLKPEHTITYQKEHKKIK